MKKMIMLIAAATIWLSAPATAKSYTPSGVGAAVCQQAVPLYNKWYYIIRCGW